MSEREKKGGKPLTLREQMMLDPKVRDEEEAQGHEIASRDVLDTTYKKLETEHGTGSVTSGAIPTGGGCKD